MYYQNDWYKTCLEPIGVLLRTKFWLENFNLDKDFILPRTWFKKYRALPGLIFLNSTRIWPVGNNECHMLNLPLPLPILEPAGFFVIGKWGKAFTKTLLWVWSLRLAAFFRNSFNLKIFLLFNLRGCTMIKPTWPYIKFEELLKNFTLRNFCLCLYLNLRGCNTIETLISLIFKKKGVVIRLVSIYHLLQK